MGKAGFVMARELRISSLFKRENNGIFPVAITLETFFAGKTLTDPEYMYMYIHVSLPQSSIRI